MNKLFLGCSWGVEILTTKNITQQWLKGVQEQQKNTSKEQQKAFIYKGFKTFVLGVLGCSWYFSLLNKNNNFINIHYVFI